MKFIKNLLCVMLVACFALTFVACTSDEPAADNGNDDVTTPVADTEIADETEEAAPAGLKVTVTDNEGTAVADVVLQVCKDTCVPSVTDAEGVANFNMEITSEHKLSVLSLPEGYEYNGEAEIYLEDGMTEFAVTVTKVA